MRFEAHISVDMGLAAKVKQNITKKHVWRRHKEAAAAAADSDSVTSMRSDVPCEMSLEMLQQQVQLRAWLSGPCSACDSCIQLNTCQALR